MRSGRAHQTARVAVGRLRRFFPDAAGLLDDAKPRAAGLNRLDEIILFNRLGRSEMKRIVDIQLRHLQSLLADRKITLEVDDMAKTWLGNTGYDPVYGARPLKRVIQRQLQNPLASMLLSGKIKDGDTVKVTVLDGQIAVNGAKLAQAA